MPFVSIIVPAYNVEDYIRECVDSILAQSFTDFELLLVDDGSVDSTGEICDHYAQNDARVRVLHKENGGLVSARKTGLEAAGGVLRRLCGRGRLDRARYAANLMPGGETGNRGYRDRGFYAREREGAGGSYSEYGRRGLRKKRTGRENISLHAE